MLPNSRIQEHVPWTAERPDRSRQFQAVQSRSTRSKDQKRDEEDVKSLIDLMENTRLNPMAPNGIDLVSLSTGSIALPDVTRDLMRAPETGEEAYQVFKQKCFEEDPPSLKFHDKMTKQSLKTFSNISTKRAHGKTAQDVVLNTRLVLHALCAANAGSEAVIITAEDTDVMVLVWASRRTSPVPSTRSVAHRTTHALLTSAY